MIYSTFSLSHQVSGQEKDCEDKTLCFHSEIFKNKQTEVPLKSESPKMNGYILHLPCNVKSRLPVFFYKAAPEGKYLTGRRSGHNGNERSLIHPPATDFPISILSTGRESPAGEMSFPREVSLCKGKWWTIFNEMILIQYIVHPEVVLQYNLANIYLGVNTNTIGHYGLLLLGKPI